MRKVSISTTFTVYHDGRFWVGVVERAEGGQLSAARVVFGAEPSDEEIFQFVLKRWGSLRFSPCVSCSQRERVRNPKRRQREVAREAAAAPSTKSQQAIAQMREQGKSEAKRRRAKARREADAAKFALKVEKRRQKRRGR